MIDSFSCIPFISEHGFILLQSLQLPYSDDITVTFNDVIIFSDISLCDGVRDMLYNQFTSNMWEFLIYFTVEL